MGNGPSTQNPNVGNPSITNSSTANPNVADLRAGSSEANAHPARDWNKNVLYYSNTPEETSGLFFSKSLGFLELGMEHNSRLSGALLSKRNYWDALSQMKRTGYDNGKARLAPSFYAGSPLLARAGSSLMTGLVGGSEKVYPMGPSALDPKSRDYKATALKFDPKELKAKKAKVVQISLVTGYEDSDQRTAFLNDARQLASSVRSVYGADISSSYVYEPEKQKDRSFAAFADYLYKVTDKLPKDSVVILEVFTHGDKSIFFDIKERKSDGKIRVETAGVLSWAPKSDTEGAQAEEVNEWEFRQLVNSLPDRLTILVRGNQCLGGQFSEGELVLPKYLAPANRSRNAPSKE